jgi:hypothetical protein
MKRSRANATDVISPTASEIFTMNTSGGRPRALGRASISATATYRVLQTRATARSPPC